MLATCPARPVTQEERFVGLINLGVVPVSYNYNYICSAGYSNYDDWEFATAHRSQKPTYPDGTAPVIPHPKFKNIIHPEVEPLYTSIPVGKSKCKVCKVCNGVTASDHIFFPRFILFTSFLIFAHLWWFWGWGLGLGFWGWGFQRVFS